MLVLQLLSRTEAGCRLLGFNRDALSIVMAVSVDNSVRNRRLALSILSTVLPHVPVSEFENMFSCGQALRLVHGALYWIGKYKGESGCRMQCS